MKFNKELVPKSQNGWTAFDSRGLAKQRKSGDTVALVGLEYINVGSLDPPVCVEVLSEVGACHGLVQLTLNERQIGLGNQTVGVRVTHEETKRNVTMGLSVAVDVLRVQSHDLGARHTG